ncbi:glutathione S-transferase [Rhodobacteraceae bacterium WD3A24]|nr:glutathione S-transferase [Rhodobacteraceae bacterium WD3A24]
MTVSYRLHYAPDNASLPVRLALEELGQPYETALVDRRSRAQEGAAYRAINPAGLIPALETPHGAIFETAAILLWLADTHAAMAPPPAAPERGDFLKWLFFTSNTLHADLRMIFYPGQYAGTSEPAQRALHDTVTARLRRHFALVDAMTTAGPVWLAAEAPSVLGGYLAALTRWAALYGTHGTDWFALESLPALHALVARLEARPATLRVARAEGLGPAPFTSPQPARPPEGAAL